MIQAIRETNFSAYINTEANRIDTSVVSANIRHLMKFTNDLDGAVFYAYAREETIFDRYTRLGFTYNITPEVFKGQLDLAPSGYYKYEAYEVSWAGTVTVDIGYAPATEKDILDVSPNVGVVQGLVAIGKLYLSELSGSEQVQYIQNAKSVQTLTIQFGGSGYTSAPAIVITGDNIRQATATCTVSGGVVNTVTITNSGSGYTTNPTVTLIGGGYTGLASITADIEQDNYIWYE